MIPCGEGKMAPMAQMAVMGRMVSRGRRALRGAGLCLAMDRTASPGSMGAAAAVAVAAVH